MPAFAPGQAHVTRRVQVTMQDQGHQGKKRPMQVEAIPLPDTSGVEPRPDKGIEQVVAIVMHPTIRFADSGENIEQFDPPVEMEVEYTAADVKATTTDARGVPRLSLSLGYQAPDGWKWEKLDTHITPRGPNGGTLHAKIHTLKPLDPLFVTRP